MTETLLVSLLLFGHFWTPSKAASPPSKSLCDHDERLMRRSHTKVVRLKATELKKRVVVCKAPALPGNFDGRGIVIITVLVGPDGTVRCLDALSGHPLLRQSALVAVRQWTFNPIKINGKLAAMTGLLPVVVSWDSAEAEKQCEGLEPVK